MKMIDTYTRTATLKDIPRLIELRAYLVDNGTGHYAPKSDTEREALKNTYRKWLTNTIDQESSISIQVICLSEKILGCVIGIIDQRVPISGALNGKMGWVQTMVVDPDFRNLGLGNALMSSIIQWFKEMNVSKVCLQTTEMALKLYQSLGFNDSGEKYLIKDIV